MSSFGLPSPPTGRSGASAGAPWWRWLVVAGLGAATVFGASQLAFLCDDAYIHFRFAANAHAGLGMVWNPPPFEPVEGAGFLWVLVLWGIWSLTGVEPPDAANPFSILCGLVQLVLLALAAARLRGRDGAVLPAAVGLCALAVVVGNRTFLQWLSSGLDTALFNTWLVWWTLHAFRAPAARGRAWLAAWSLAAALAALTRPDGLPLACATVGVAGLAWLRGQATARATLVGLSPLLLVVALTLWRLGYYGEWLPNTYYAKVVSAWPEAGVRYFACFALENGAWLWLPIAALWLAVAARQPRREVAAALAAHVPAVAAVAVVLFNAGYYLLKVGGDHFEYRVLSQLVPLGTLACAAMAARVGRGPWLPVAAAMALGIAGSASWFHLAWTRDASAEGIAAITPRVPAIVRPIARWFDRQQVWLFFRYIGLRCNHHAARLETLRARFPARVRLAADANDVPIRAESAIGLPGWCMPELALIDVYGLTDWVVARTPTSVRVSKSAAEVRAIVERCDADHDGWLGDGELRDALQGVTGTRPEGPYAEFFMNLFWQFSDAVASRRVTLEQAVGIAMINDTPRLMAHERRPPPGYVEAFEPNVEIDAGGAVTVKPRGSPMTAERIRAIETQWRAKVRGGQLPR